MDFTLNPDEGPPRLIRFVGPEAMPSNYTIATLDRTNNLLLVNYHLYEQLSPDDQRRILTTRQSVVDVELIAA